MTDYCPECKNKLKDTNVIGEHHDEWEEMYYCKECNKYWFACETLSKLEVLKHKK